jgi:hypothetical protein
MCKSIFRFLQNLFLPSLPSLAQACASCSFDDVTNSYYLKMIVLLSVLPLMFIGGVILYIRHHRKFYGRNE